MATGYLATGQGSMGYTSRAATASPYQAYGQQAYMQQRGNNSRLRRRMSPEEIALANQQDAADIQQQNADAARRAALAIEGMKTMPEGTNVTPIMEWGAGGGSNAENTGRTATRSYAELQRRRMGTQMTAERQARLDEMQKRAGQLGAANIAQQKAETVGYLRSQGITADTDLLPYMTSGIQSQAVREKLRMRPGGQITFATGPGQTESVQANPNLQNPVEREALGQGRNYVEQLNAPPEAAPAPGYGWGALAASQRMGGSARDYQYSPEHGRYVSREESMRVPNPDLTRGLESRSTPYEPMAAPVMDFPNPRREWQTRNMPPAPMFPGPPQNEEAALAAEEESNNATQRYLAENLGTDISTGPIATGRYSPRVPPAQPAMQPTPTTQPVTPAAQAGTALPEPVGLGVPPSRSWFSGLRFPTELPARSPIQTPPIPSWLSPEQESTVTAPLPTVPQPVRRPVTGTQPAPISAPISPVDQLGLSFGPGVPSQPAATMQPPTAGYPARMQPREQQFTAPAPTIPTAPAAPAPVPAPLALSPEQDTELRKLAGSPVMIAAHQPWFPNPADMRAKPRSQPLPPFFAGPRKPSNPIEEQTLGEGDAAAFKAAFGDTKNVTRDAVVQALQTTKGSVRSRLRQSQVAQLMTEAVPIVRAHSPMTAEALQNLANKMHQGTAKEEDVDVAIEIIKATAPEETRKQLRSQVRITNLERGQTLWPSVPK
jgi:rRNA-processing protein FCF1